MRINVVHAMPSNAQAFNDDHDGFTAAMEVIAQRHDVRWLDVHPYNEGADAREKLIADADFVLVRSDWGWLPCAATDRALRGRTSPPVGLLIAGSNPPPSARESLRFDVLFYETPWYAQFVKHHPFTVEAFGVDTRIMRDTGADRDLDWLMVGRLASFKRPLRLLEKQGNRLAIGDLASAPAETRRQLEDDGVTIIDYVPQASLASFYNRAQRVLVACELQGGGERSVLEGRACGCEVEIASDNPKLASLLDAPLYDHEQYAAALESSIHQVIEGRRVSPTDKLSAQRAARRAVLWDKVLRAPSTVAIRTRSAWARRSRPQ